MINNATKLRIYKPLIHYAVFTVVLLALTAALEDLGGLSGLWWHKVLELPLVLYLYFFFRQLLHGQRGGPVLAAVPVVLVYLLFDAYFLLFGRVFRLSEMREVPELLDILPWYTSLPILVGVLVPLVWILTRMRVRSLRWLMVSVAPLVLVAGSIVFRPDLFLVGFASAANGMVEWSDAEAVRWNGRLSMVLYHEAKREAAVREVADYTADTDYEQSFQQTLATLSRSANKRNIHVMVLEGFVDPARFEHLQLNRDPLQPGFRALLADGRGDLAISPVFGGYTAQAEFEVLCGAPALQVLGTIEFNIFTGARVHCLPDVLDSLGYRTVISRGYKPHFFNALMALRGTGFEEIYFAREYAPNRDTYISTGDVRREKYMFDKTLLDQNLDFVRQHLATRRDEPLLNYVLTIYGHYPYRLDEALRPRLIEPLGPAPADEELKIVLNQLYYRSKAVAAYVQELMALDPDSLILFVSDHLPPLQEGIKAYERLGYLGGRDNAAHHTLLSVLDAGRPLSLGSLHQYEIPTLIYRVLTDGAYCEDGSCGTRSPQSLRNAYLRIMAHAVSDPA